MPGHYYVHIDLGGDESPLQLETPLLGDKIGHRWPGLDR